MAAALRLRGTVGRAAPRQRRVAQLPPPLDRLIGRSRRRLITRALLSGALAAVAANVLVMLSLEVLNRALDRQMRTPLVAVPIFLAIALRARWSVRAGTAAAALDRAAGLQDRLTTALDLAGRTDVDGEMRSAQLDETLARVRGLEPSRVIGIHPLLWSGPALLGGLLLFAAYVNFAPRTGVPLRLVAVPGVRSRRAAPPGSPRGGGERPERVEGQPGGRGAEQHGARARAPREGADTAATSVGTPPPGTGPAAGPRQEGQSRPEQTAARGQERARRGERLSEREPARLFSEPVTAALTPVAERPLPAARGAGEKPAPPQGRVSFNLIPLEAMEGGDGAGRGGRGGGTDRAVEITVDFDALPPEHRELVRRYFEALQRPRDGSGS